MKKSVQEANQIHRKRQRNIKRIIMLGVGLFALAGIILGFALTSAANKLMGDPVKIDTSKHVVTGSIPGPYNSNPPAGGSHYEETFDGGFYEESDVSYLPVHPEGYLVHNLEHGYIIFWYNCKLVEDDCLNLKSTIRAVMAESGKTKLIAFPWQDMEVPLAMTSWGRIMSFSSSDETVMKQFVTTNYNQAPEPEGD